jgi:HEPN domain-containing protein
MARGGEQHNWADAQPSGAPGQHYAADDAEAAIADAELVMRSVDDTWSQLAQEAGR